MHEKLMTIAALAALVAGEAIARDVNPVGTISAPASAPIGASRVIDKRFSSFSIPSMFMADYAGNASHPNLFSWDILNLLYEKTGEHPQIRLGGTALDRTTYVPNQDVSTIATYGRDQQVPKTITIGPAFFDVFDNFPGSKWVFQVNFFNRTEGGRSNAMQVARMVLDKLGNSLEAFEIGNEPNWSYQDLDPYVRDWLDYADEVSSTVLKGNKYGIDAQKFFQGLTFYIPNKNGFDVIDSYNAGIANSGHMKSISNHKYSYSKGTLRDTWLNHEKLVEGMAVFTEQMDYMQMNHPDTDFNLGETQMSSKSIDQHDIESVFGSALWMVDYSFHAMTMNFTRCNFILGTKKDHASWVPVEYDGRQPHVRPMLYGQIVTADVIGKHPEVRVAELQLSRPDFSAYAVYQADKLAKYVLVNLDEWNSTTTYARPVQNVALDVPSGAKQAQIQRLTAPGSNVETNVTWGGLSWDYQAGRLVQSGASTVRTVSVKDSKLNVKISSTECLVVTFT